MTAQGQAVGQVGGDVLDAVLVGDLAGLVQVAADQRDDFDAIDVLDAVEVLLPERARTGERHFDGHAWFSRIRWPTAVFDAGT